MRMGSACSTAKAEHVLTYEEPGYSVGRHESRMSSRKGNKSSRFSLSDSDFDSDQSVMQTSHHSRNFSRDSVSYAQTADDIYESLPPAPPQKPRGTPVDPKVPMLAEFPREFKKMATGRLDIAVPLENKVVHVFHCCNFTDSEHERSLLLHHVYPALREACVERGCDLEVIDLLWGLQDEFAFQNAIPDFTQYTLRQLKQNDPDSLFVLFFNERYGVYWSPSAIGTEVFTSMLKKVTEDDKHFLLQWYQLDPHLEPPLYVLQPVDRNIPRHGERSLDAYYEGFREWEKQLIRLRNVISQASSLEFQKYALKSPIDEQLEESVLSGAWTKDRIIWCRRVFKNFTFETLGSDAGFYTDLVGNRLNENAQSRLQVLCERLRERVDANCTIEMEVAWNEEGFGDDHKKYLHKLGERYKAVVTSMADRVLEKREALAMRRVKLVHRGLSAQLYTELIQHTHVCQTLLDGAFSRQQLTDQLETYVQYGELDTEVKVNTILPLLVCGPAGVGKSSVAAGLVTTLPTVPGWGSAVCVMRFVGASMECEDMAQLRTSVTQHVCLLANLPVTAADNVNGVELDLLLKKVPTSTPLLLLIDDIEKVKGTNFNVRWLPKKLPSHIRVIITVTTNSPVHQALQKHLAAETGTLEVPLLTWEEALAMATVGLDADGCRMPGEIDANIQETFKDGVTPLVIKVLTRLLLDLDLDDSDIGDVFDKDLKGMINMLFERMEHKFTKHCVGTIASLIHASRFGLSDTELNDILSCDSSIMNVMYPFKVPRIQRPLWFVYAAVQKFLSPVIQKRVCNGHVLAKWRHLVVGEVVRERYRSLMDSSTQLLLQYFSGSWHGKKRTQTSPDSSSKDVEVSCCVRSQKTMYKYGANKRKVDELPYLLARQKTATAMSTLSLRLFDMGWICAKLKASGVYALLQDLAFLPKGDFPQAKLLEQILHSIYTILTHDPAQFPELMVMQSQYKSLSDSIAEYPDLQNLLLKCAKCVPIMLVPSDENAVAATFESQTNKQTALGGIFRVKDDTKHVITVSPAAGEMKVYNIYNREVVRTFQGLAEPKDAKMCDTYTAVVLCSRELKVFNLDNGAFIATLKGVLNINMPYYGIHDKVHTVAMARNRMYVNMMNNSTGEMVTTFKLGEDRFMDSLMVSENGDVCVGGDAVQKPFPLLVWNLHSHKLVYDLRIRGHEFLTKMAAVSQDGHYVVSVCREIDDPEPNFVVVYDLQSGSMFRKWKPDYSTTSVAISVQSQVVVSAQEDGLINVYDLISESRRCQLRGHCRGPDRLCLSADGWRCVSYDTTGRDTAVRYWDLHDGKCLGCFFPGCPVTCCDVSADGAMVIAGLPSSSDLVTLHVPGSSTLYMTDSSVFGDASRKGSVYEF